MRPSTLPEWAQYIASLSGEALRSKAIAANSIGFMDQLLEESYSPDEVETIMVLLARQFGRTGQEPPGRTLHDYQELATRPLPIEVELPEPWVNPEPEADDLDGFLTGAE